MMMLSPVRKNVKRSQIQVEEDPECDGADLRPSKKLKPTELPSFISSTPHKFIIRPVAEDTTEDVVRGSSIDKEEITETTTTECGLFSRVFTSLRTSEEDILYNNSKEEDEEADLNSSEVEESEEATSSSESISLCAEAELTDDRTDGELSGLADWGEDESESEPEIEVFNPYTFIKNLPARPWPCVGVKQLLPAREPGDKRVCLVLDLDETLVHCSTEPLQHPDLVFPVVFNEVTYTVFARKRPYIEKFLLRMAQIFEIVVFTASQEVYADKLLNILDPEGTLIKHRLFRDSCVFVDNNYLKDLSLLGRDLSQTIIVDNSPQAFGYQIDNGIPIESWFDDDLDTELLDLSSFLESMTSVQDVRPLLREKYKLHELISCA